MLRNPRNVAKDEQVQRISEKATEIRQVLAEEAFDGVVQNATTANDALINLRKKNSWDPPKEPEKSELVAEVEMVLRAPLDTLPDMEVDFEGSQPLAATIRTLLEEDNL